MGKKRSPNEWIDERQSAKIIFDGSYRRVRFNNGKIGLAAMTERGLQRLTDKCSRGEMSNFTISWWDCRIFMAIQK